MLLKRNVPFPGNRWNIGPKTGESPCPLVLQGGVSPATAELASLTPNPVHVFRALEKCSLPSVIVAVITQMICSTVTSSQRCHLKLKIHVKTRDVTFKQTVET